MSDTSDEDETETEYEPKSSLKKNMVRPIIMMSWTKIRQIIIISYILNIFATIYSLCLMYSAVKTQKNIGDFLNMVSDGDGTILPVCLGLSGLICLPVNVLLLHSTIKTCKRDENIRINNILFILVCLCCFLIIFLLSMGIYALSHAYSLHQRLEDGIMDHMKQYISKPHMKMRMDILQINFQCCGSRSYNDWFKLQWHEQSNIEGMEEGLQDETPFSCCSMRSHFPCIHTDVMAIGSAYLYAPESNFSISGHGCHTVLLQYTRSVAWKTAAGFLGLAAIEALIGAATRLIQTGHMEFYEFKRHDYLHTTWLIGKYERKKKKIPPEPPPIPLELRD